MFKTKHNLNSKQNAAVQLQLYSYSSTFSQKYSNKIKRMKYISQSQCLYSKVRHYHCPAVQTVDDQSLAIEQWCLKPSATAQAWPSREF